MCRLPNKAMHDFQESLTTGQTHGWTDMQTDRQKLDKAIPMCHFASQATQKTLRQRYRVCIPLHTKLIL